MLGTQCTGHRKEARGSEVSGIYFPSISTWFIHALQRFVESGSATVT